MGGGSGEREGGGDLVHTGSGINRKEARASDESKGGRDEGQRSRES